MKAELLEMANTVKKAKLRTGDEWKDRLTTRATKTGPVLVSVTWNAITILANDSSWIETLAFDEFASEIITLRQPSWQHDDGPAFGTYDAGPWTDVNTIRTQAWLGRVYGLHLGRESVRDAIAVVAERRKIHPVRDWLDDLEWDNVQRADTWLTEHFGVDDNLLTRRVGVWFLVGAVARIYEPGCKVDTMPVFEGPQGLGKSTGLRVLFSDKWFTDTPLDLASKDRFVGLKSKWCVEMAELDSLGRSDVDRIKSFLSSASDSYRPPYGRSNVNMPRQCVFAGTVNRDDYLRDETGNRRFFPVRCSKIDLSSLARDREQLWAEAVALYRAKEPWWPQGDEAGWANASQRERVSRDAWEPLIEEYVRGKDRVTVGNVLSIALQIEPGKWGQPEQNRVARSLRLLGFARKRGKADADGQRPWFYDRVLVEAPCPSVEIEVGQRFVPDNSLCPSSPSSPSSSQTYESDESAGGYGRKSQGQTGTLGLADDPSMSDVEREVWQ